MKHLDYLKTDKSIKRFNELFDDETLKSEHEIDYLTGDLQKNILKGEYGSFFDKEGGKQINALLERLMHKGCYQLLVFFIEPKFEIQTKHWTLQEDEILKKSKSTDLFHLLGLKNKEFELILGIKLRPNDKYDVLLTAKGKRDNSEMKRDISFDELYSYVKYTWTEYLYFFGERKLIEYGKQAFITQNN